MTEQEREKVVIDLASGTGLNTEAYAMALEIKRFLHTIRDTGTGVDSGVGHDVADLHAWIGGKEWHIAIRATGRTESDRERRTG